MKLGHAALVLAFAAPALAQQPFWDTHGGTATVTFDGPALRAVGLEPPAAPVALTIRDELGSGLFFAGTGARLEALFRGQLRTGGELVLNRLGGGQQVRLGNVCFVLSLRNDGSFSGCVSDGVLDLVAFELASTDARAGTVLDVAAQRFGWNGLEMRVAAGWAQAIGLPAAAGARVGTVSMDAPISAAGSFYTVSPDDCGCGVDQGENSATSSRVPVPSRNHGEIDRAGDLDVFAIELVAGVRYRIGTSLLTNGTDTVIELRDANGTTILADDDDGGAENLASLLEWTAARNGTHYVLVREYTQTQTGGYDLLIEGPGMFAPPPPGTGVTPGSGDDHGDVASGATRITVGQSLAGRIDRAADVDMFAVDLAANQPYVFRTGQLAGGMDTILALIDRDGVTQIVDNDDSTQGAGGLASYIARTVTTAGTYYLTVVHYDDTATAGTYALFVEQAGAPVPPPPPPPPPGPPVPNPNPRGFTHVVASSSGPDVIVGDLHDLARYGRVNGITAFAVGTVSCNIGTQELSWISNNNRHPVIGSNLYRIKDGRLEQVGMSWLKHGFFALSENLCFNDCQATSGDALGVHCSDPYSAGLNGSQSNLGPRSEVNAATGVYPYPYSAPATMDQTIGLRLQVKDADLNPALNASSMYFVEGIYIASDDAAAGNAINNASARRVRVTGSGTNWNLEYMAGEQTRRQKPAIEVWRDLDPDVRLEGVDVAGDGHFDVACKVSRNADGSWHYEYAVYNMTSDRSARSFSVPVAPGSVVRNIGFHDVDYHSGEPYDGTDWVSEFANGAVTWVTRTFQQDRNANALRWSTMYNFRFDCDRGPEASTATIGLFKPGAAANPTVAVQGPGTGGGADTTAPVFAGATGVTALGQTELDVAWAAATDDRSQPANISYLVYVSDRTGGQDFAAAPAVTVRGQTRAVVSGLRPGTEYFVVVRARDEVGNTDANTAQRSGRTDAAGDVAPPTFAGAGMATGVSETEIELQWNAASDDVSPASAIRYRVYVATSAGGQDFTRVALETPAGATRATVGGLTAGTRYWAVVRAVDQANREEQNRLEVSAETWSTLGPITPPSVEVGLTRPWQPGGYRPGQTVGFNLRLRNVTAQAATVRGEVLLETPAGNLLTIGQTAQIGVAANTRMDFQVNLPLPANTPAGRYVMTVIVTDAAGGVDIANNAFTVVP